MLQNAVARALYAPSTRVAYHKIGSCKKCFSAQNTKFGHIMARDLASRRLRHSKMEGMHESLYLIVGIGNTLRRDDGAGIWLAEAVARAMAEQGHVVEIRLLQQLLPEMAEEIGEMGAQTVVIADCSAAADAGQKGSAERLRPLEEGRREHLRSGGQEMGSHGLGAAELIELARRLYGFGGEAWLATVPGVDFNHGEGLSPITRAAIDHLAPAIMDLIS